MTSNDYGNPLPVSEGTFEFCGPIESSYLDRFFDDFTRLKCSKCNKSGSKYVEIVTGKSQLNWVKYLYCIKCFKKEME